MSPQQIVDLSWREGGWNKDAVRWRSRPHTLVSRGRAFFDIMNIKKNHAWWHGWWSYTFHGGISTESVNSIHWLFLQAIPFTFYCGSCYCFKSVIRQIIQSLGNCSNASNYQIILDQQILLDSSIFTIFLATLVALHSPPASQWGCSIYR